MENEFKDTEIGKIPVDWEIGELKDLANITMGQSPPSKTYNECGEGLPFFQGRKDFGLKYPTVTMWCNEPKKTAEKGDVLISVRAPVGDINMSIQKCCIGRGLASLTHKVLDDNEFLYYLMKESEKRLVGMYEGTGTVFSAVTKNDLTTFTIPFPPLEEQQKIAQILSSIDDKIENNNQQNKILEETANSIFKEWFVDFNFLNEDGLSYLENGGEMEFNEDLGSEIPKDWKVGKLRDVVDYYIGGGWGKEEKENDFPQDAFVIRGTDIPNARYGGIKDIPLRYHKESNYASRTIKPFDIVLEVSGGSKGQPVGRSLMILPELLNQLDNKLICASFCKLMRLKDIISPYYVDLFIKDLYSTEKIMLYQQQSTGISNFKFEFFLDDVNVIIPNERIKEQFNDILKDIYSKIGQNGIQSQILAKKRDLLLPKLMNGEIRLK
ncbi:restriction endonuclease subunit S [Methanococcus maripaludis]|uniref:EcoKI restriction-modification system protein HsdS n=1 Tax=Methanococcus maripaludis TaxID=39152 RepID=A0A2L1C9H9_METMI|nr:restriction endonuclease subunit S [Methanococcus maripaludis]AVB75969.1 EcoKI restriction-modification system protein HsdS [Methanococcus maripaludis]